METYYTNIIKILSEKACNEAAIRPESNLATDLDIDSLAFIEIISALEEEFDIILNEEDVAEVNTVGELCRVINVHVKDDYYN